MTMDWIRIVIDGYNLLHQTPVMQTGSGAVWLHQQRINLVQRLAKLLTPSERTTTMCVFDAHTDRSPNTTDFVLDDIRVCFAHNHREADDFIEELIEQHPSPQSLLVVSSDRRIQSAARYRQAQTTNSREWFDKITSRYTTSLADSTTLDNGTDPEAIKNVPLVEQDVDAWTSYLEMEDVSMNKTSDDRPAPKPKAAPKRSPKPDDIKSTSQDNRQSNSNKKLPGSVRKKTKSSPRIKPEGITPSAEDSGIDPKILKRANRKLPDDGPLFPEDYFDGVS